MLEKKYNHKLVEKGKYDLWIKNKCFECGDLSKRPFCIVIPPPNVTGKLHLGHAWDTSIQDIIIRYKKMKGFDTLWLPGMDHAGIATQAKIDAKLKSEGINPRKMDREEWMNHAWEWKEKYAGSIREQWEKLGLSLDYTKERFTLDEGLSKAVRKIFIDLYNKGWIYRGERIINWDPEAMTALSNEEVIHKDVKGAFYHIKYFIDGTNDYLEVATTRPETLFGDTAVAVNPKDERYKHLIGKYCKLPMTERLIPIVGDGHADMDFGTGIVKITPAHDPNDFEVGVRHNLERIICMNPNGTMNENAVKYNKMDRFECREALIKDLKEKDLLIKIDEMIHSVGHSERTDVMVEPYLSKQWFVKMEPLVNAVLINQKNSETKINFIPKRYEKQFIHWMQTAPDWCISRQLWWGHRVPAWYKNEEVYVGEDDPKGKGWIQDSDVLDTWFSSALWPFSTLGWPEETEFMKRYYPNDVLVTGYDIIPFWVCRMAFQGLEFAKQRPFKECIIHGLIRDKEGRKVSKSLGNGVDPMDIIDEYGADALRYFITTATAPGLDLRYDEDKVKSTWNFINKIWNASRYTLIRVEGLYEKNYKLDNLSDIDKWILNKLNDTIKLVTKYMEKYEFNNVGNILYSFIWNDFCDNYIELSKFSEDNVTKSTLIYILTAILKMLEPFMPYVTEEIYNMLPIKETKILMNSRYPEYDKKFNFKESKKVDSLIEFITTFRNKKVELNIGSDFEVILDTDNNPELIIKMLKLTDKLVSKSNHKGKSIIEIDNIHLEIYFDDSKNKEAENELIEKEINELTSSIQRRENLLSNENYISKAPESIVLAEKENLKREKERLEILKR